MSLLIQNENFITQSGYKEIFLFNEIFCLLSQILDFTAFGPKAQWSNSQKANFVGLKKVSSETP